MTTKKPALLMALLFIVLAVVPACDAAVRADVAAETLATAAAASQADLPPMNVRASSEEGFDEWASRIYGINTAAIDDAYVYYASGMQADEVAVFRMASASDAEEAKAALNTYKETRAATFTGYAPEEEKMAEDGIAFSQGSYAALLICPSPNVAEDAFTDALSGESSESGYVPTVTPEPSEQPTATPVAEAVSSPDAGSMPPEVSAVPATTPVPAEAPVPEQANPEGTPLPIRTREPDNPDDIFDADVVLAAWQGGSGDGLTGRNLAVYNKAAEVLPTITNDSMSEFEKEIAVHDYLIRNMEYDEDHVDHEDLPVNPDSLTAYGGLINGIGICYGYSHTFDLLMKMLGIESIIVDGTANSINEPHSWNQVNLDGNWYCVDVRWDDSRSDDEISYYYFNKTSDEFTESNRKWDRETVPEATGGPYSIVPQ